MPGMFEGRIGESLESDAGNYESPRRGVFFCGLTCVLARAVRRGSLVRGGCVSGRFDEDENVGVGEVTRRMTRLAWRSLPLAAAALAVCALGAAGLAAAPDPHAVLVAAVKQTNAARSVNLVLTEHITVGKTRASIRMSGVEAPKAGTGSFTLVTTPAQQGLGQMTEVLVGSRVYIHYGLLDTLHLQNPAIKHWLAVDTGTSLGIDPSNLALLGAGEAAELTGLKVVGTGSVQTTPVTLYRGSLDLGKLEQSGVIKQLLSHLPSAASLILKGKDTLELSVGSDGYIHESSSSLKLRDGKSVVNVEVDVTLTDFDKSIKPIVAPAARDTMTLAQFDKLTGIGPTPAETALLNKVVLKASQVGAGYKLTVIPGGTLVQGEATLDFCQLTYPSEALRNARLQVVYTGKGKTLTASNEVVTYQPGGAQQALREAAAGEARCPNGPVTKNLPAGVTRFVRKTTLIKDPHLPAGSVAFTETDTGIQKGKPFTSTSVAIYQVRGNVLSGVYTASNGATVPLAFVENAANASAANLKRYVAGAPVA